MPNTCKNCEKIVTPDPKDGHCPECGAKAGYSVSRTWTLRHRIEDERDEIKRIIDKKFKEYDEYIKQGKNQEFFKNLKKSLEKQIPEFLVQAEKNYKERLEKEEKQREQHTQAFTMDVVISSEKQEKIHELENYIQKIETEKNHLHTKLETENLINEEFKKTIEKTALNVKIIKDRLSPKTTIVLSLILGIVASITASLVVSNLLMKP